MDWDMRVRRAPDIEIREVSEGFVAYDPARDRLHFLNLTATMLLETCDGKVPARDLPELLAAAYRLESPPCRRSKRASPSCCRRGCWSTRPRGLPDEAQRVIQSLIERCRLAQ